jgi:two-component system sensor histidine kinase PilS (NtrC family)
MAAATDPGLHRKLVWLNLFRVIAVTVLLGGTAVVTYELWAEGKEPTLAPLYGVVIATYAASMALSFALRLRVRPSAVAWAQVGVDVGLAAALVAVTGRAESVFVFMFLLAVVNAAIVLFRRGAVVAAALGLAGYLLVTLALPGSHLLRIPTVFVHGSAFFLVAALASYLAEQLRATGERLAERESDLAAITGLHESIVQSMTSGLVTLDGRGTVTYLNPAGEHMAGVTLAAARGRPAAGFIPAFEQTTGRGEVEHVTPRGERLLLGYSTFPLVGADAAPLGTAIIFQDLTRLRAMEEAVRRSARLADLGGVAAGLAHELRNPLASISGAVELLRSGAPVAEDDRRLMDIVLKEADRLNELVTGFLQFARPAPPKRTRVDLASVLDETLSVFTHDPAAARLRLERDLHAASVDCDAGQMRQVLWNLLLNSAQALTDVRRGDGRSGRILVGCAPSSNGGATFSVEDDGPGIAPAERERVFLPFHTTKERGTGLGLATVHRIVDAHGGQVIVSSARWGGACFTVCLPGGAPAAAERG